MRTIIKPVVIVALKEESNGLLESHGIDVLYTGIGKVNATYHLTKEIINRKQLNTLPPIFINFGTAGSKILKVGDLVSCHKFVQRDMDVTGLGFEFGVTPFEEGPKVISHDKFIKGTLPEGLCGSGDSFEVGKPKINCDVIDMEAYALAKVCYNESLPFVSIKYISDGAGEEAQQEWNQNLKKAAHKFIEFYQSFLTSDLI